MYVCMYTHTHTHTHTHTRMYIYVFSFHCSGDVDATAPHLYITHTHTHTYTCKYILCIAAAMWTRPHLICLDEPTNFLDKETFNGLVRALKNFKGAVLTISHNQEFVEQVYMRSLFIFSPHHFSSSCCLSLRINRSW